jgi:hypothetical protein
MFLRILVTERGVKREGLESTMYAGVEQAGVQKFSWIKTMR